MSARHKLQDATGIIASLPIVGAILAAGKTVPTDATAGYAPGCLFIDIDAAGGLQLYINEGSVTSCAFKVIPSGTSGTAALITATAAVITGLTATNITGTVGASTAAAGSSTSDAGALPAGTGFIYPTTAADDTTGVKINAADKVTGRVIFIGNGVANKILKIYGPTGAVINGASADAAYSTKSGGGALVACLSGSGNTWLALG